MNQPPNQSPSGMNVPPGYGPPPGYPPQSGPMPQSGSYPPPPQSGVHGNPYGPPPIQHHPGFRGMTRQIFNPASYRQTGSGSWAASSLIISLVSFIFCGFLSPISLVLGMVGLVGNKRAKGMSFAGVLISLVQIGFWAIVFIAGAWTMMYTEDYANQAGAPVVAAIEQFQSENQRVPHSLDELVAGGYLPTTWDHGVDDLAGPVQESIKGKKWSDFLRYKAGANADWDGSGWDGTVRFNDGSLTVDFKSGGNKEHKTYGLVFIGIDGIAGTSDDAKVNQKPATKFDLSRLWSGDETTRQAMKSRHELQGMINKIDNKLTEVNAAIEKSEGKLAEHKQKIKSIMDRKKIRTFEQAREDDEAGEWIQLAGETARLVQAFQNKANELGRTRNKLEVQMERLGNQVEMAKLADSKEELAKLQLLLEESRKTLEREDSAFASKSEDEAAEEWFRKNFR
ncbi:MAG: hypothetical protein KF696_00565 [Planctomycetes bacterium]|nr:hypothetical protein [Planctomycetota bacterium]MCW8134568.1 hypothetical protein [Planctomycetota bacterium]